MPIQGLLRSLRVLFCAATLFAASQVVSQEPKTFTGNESQALTAVRSVGRPLTFEANQGQASGDIRFLSHGKGYQLSLAPNEAIVSLASSRTSPQALRLKLAGANSKSAIVGEDKLAATTNYYIGNSPSNWRTGIPNYSRVRSLNVYPGIDLVYYGNQQVLEHDFVVAPGADPRRIKLELSGARSVHLDTNGDLVLDLDSSSLRLLKPVVYQEVAGKRRTVEGAFELTSNNVAQFKIGTYDKRRELIIDPRLSYSTYLGGSAYEEIKAVAVKGNEVWVTGFTYSPNIPGASNACVNCGAFEDVFVTAFNLNGALVFSTYLGGHGTNESRAIAVDGSGNAYVGGYTEANDFPIASSGLSGSTLGGTFDGFISVLSSTGTLTHSGYFGGLGEDQVLGLAFDPVTAHVVATGYTTSTNFPSASAIVPNLKGQLYLTQDAASTWALSSGTSPTNLGGMDVLAFLVVPGSLSPTRYWAGGSMGVYTSTDGVTWTASAGFNHNKVTCLVKDPAVSGSVYACTDAGLFKFNPTSNQWVFQSTISSSYIQINALVVDQTTPTKVYAGTGLGVFVSTDSGLNWTPANNGLLNTNVFSLVQDSTGNLYAGTGYDGTNPVFYWSVGANSWQASSNNGLPIGGHFATNSLKFDSTTNRIYAGIYNNGGYVTTDGGANWTALGAQLLTGLSANIEAFAVDPFTNSTIYVGTDDGVWQSVDSGATFFRSDVGLSATTVHALAVDPGASLQQGSAVLYAGVDSKQGFIATFSNTLSNLTSTTLGGDGIAWYGGTHVNTPAVDSSGNIYAVGNTPSTIPNTASGAQPTRAGLDDGFIVALNSSGSSLWSTYVGGSGYESINSVAVSASDSSIVVGGYTQSSSDFPTKNAVQTTCNGACGFIAKYTSAGAKTFASYFGNDPTWVQGVAVNPTSGVIWFDGSTNGGVTSVNPLPNFPATISERGYIAELPANGSSLLFSSMFGGTNGDTNVTAIALDSTGAAYAAGSTGATDFPLAGAPVQSTQKGFGDGFVIQLTDTGKSNDVSISVSPGTVNVASGVPQTYNITIANNTSTGAGATGVALTTDFKADVASVTLSSPNGTCTSGPGATCQFGTIAANGSVIASAQVTYLTSGTYANNFYAHTDDNDPVPANNEQSVVATVSSGSTDLGVSLTSPAKAAHDGQFQYTLTVTNNGPSAAGPFTVDVALDSSLEVVSADDACIFDGPGDCSSPGLNPGASQTFLITVLAPSTQGSVSSQASVTYANDPNSSNNTSTASTNIVASADLSVYSSTNGYATVGAPFTVDLTIQNIGPDNAADATLVVSLPSQVKLQSSTLPCTGTTTLTCDIGAVTQSEFGITQQLVLVPNLPGAVTISGAIQDSVSADPSPNDNQFTGTIIASPNGYSGESYVISDAAAGAISVYPVGSSATYGTHSRASSGPGISAIDITGRYMYVTATGFGNYISVVDLSIQREVMRIRGAGGRPMSLTPDGSRLIARVPSTTTDALAVIDTSTFQIIKTISLDGLFGDQVGVSDINIISGAVANNKLYLELTAPSGTGQLGTTAVIDLGTFSVNQVTGAGSTTAVMPSQQRTIASSANQSKVYAIRRTPAEVLVIDTNSDSVVNTILLPMAFATAIDVTKDPNDPAGQFAYVAGRSNATNAPILAAVDLNQGTVLAAQEALSFVPTNIALSADGTFMHGIRTGVVPGNNAFYLSTADLREGAQTVTEYNVGPAGGLSLGFVQTYPQSYAPQISSIVPNAIDNSTSNKISILGSNFATNSRVKIGTLDVMTPTFVSTGRLDVTVPKLAPEQGARIVVTLPNTQELPTGRNVSGTSEIGLPITNQAFSLPNSILLMSYGQSELSVVDTSKKSVDMATLANPFSIAIAPDNKTAYVSSTYVGTGIQAINLTTGQAITTIALPNDIPGYQDSLATGTDPVDGKAVLYFSSGNSNQTSNQLTIVDADSASATFNQVKRTVNTNDNAYVRSWAIAVSPSGRYVYSAADNQTGDTDLIAYDTQTSTFHKVTGIHAAFNGEIKPNHMRMSVDGNWLMLPGADGSIKALNISADPLLNNYNVTTLSDAGKSFKTFQQVGNRLFGFDSNTNTVTAFNFVPASSNFSKLGSVMISGPGSFYESPLLVDPSGNYVYVALKDQDAIAVLDANKVAASDPTALLDTGGDTLGIEALLIASPATPQVDLAAALTNAVSYPTNGTGYMYATVVNNSVNDATNVVATFTVPNGLAISSASWYTSGNNSAGDFCTVTSIVVCTTPTLAGGDTIYYTIFFTAPSSPTSLPFSMAVTSTETDSVPSNNSAAGSIPIVAGADATVSAQLPATPLQAGKHVTFTITATNLGPATPSSFTVSFSIGLNNLVITPPDGFSCDAFNSCKNASGLAPNTPAVFSIGGNVPQISSSVSVEAFASSPLPEPNNENNKIILELPVVSAGAFSDQFLVPDRGRGSLTAITPATAGYVPGGNSMQVGVTPVSLVPMPNGRTVFVVNFESNYISVYDVSVQAEIYRIHGEPGRAAVLSSDASQLFVANRFDTTLIDVYDTSTFALVKHISVSGITGHLPVSNMLVAGTNLYLMTNQTGPIYSLNLNTSVLSAIASTSTYGTSLSHRFALTPDGNTVVAIGGGDPTTPAKVYLINAAAATVAKTITLPTNTKNLTVATTPNTGGNVYGYVTMDSSLQMLDLTPASPTFGQFLSGINVTLPLSPTSSVITSDGVTLGFVESVFEVSPNVATVNVASLLTTPVIEQTTSGTYPGAISDIQADFLPSSNSPQITSVTPEAVFNNVANTLQIEGSGFSSDAVVKVGSANPIVPTNGSSTSLTVTIPAFTPSDNQTVTVINRNAAGPLSDRNIASTASIMTVSDAPGFTPIYDTYTANYGSSTYMGNGSQGSDGDTTQVLNPWGIAITAGDAWYVASYTSGAAESSIGDEGTTFIPLSGGVAYGDSIAMVPDPTTGRNVALVPSYYSPTNGIYDWQLNVIDVDPYSPTLNLVLRTVPAHVANATQTAAAFAATPDGKFAYHQVMLANGSSDLVIYNVSTGQVTTLTSSGLGIDSFVQGMQVSPDSKHLVVANINENVLKVFSISNPVSPSLVQTITLANPNSVPLTDCCNLRFASGKLYTFDPGTMLLQVFNFNPTGSSTAAGILQLPGHPDPTFQGGLAVSPDGAFVYIAEMDDDAVEVIDGTKIATNDITQALLTRFSSGGAAPVSIALNPLPTFSVTADLSIAVSHTPEPVLVGANTTYHITVNNLGPNPSGQVVVSDVLPPGLSFVGATISGAGTGTCSGTTTVTCTFTSMAANGITIIDLVASTSGATAGQITNVVAVGQLADAIPDPNPANNTATDLANAGLPDLTVTVTPDVPAPSIGGTVNYTVSLTNNGTLPATNVTVTLTQDAGGLALPNGTYPNCTHDFNNPAQNFVCTYASIDPGATVSFVEAASMPSVQGSVHLTTVATETETDANSADNTTVTTVPVGGGADVSIAAAGAPVIINGVPTYSVVVTNNGPGQAQDVTLRDQLTRFQFVSATSTVGGCSFNGADVVCPLGNMNNGASVTVNVSVTPPSSGWASNDFRTTSDTFDPVPTNNAISIGPFGGTIGNTRAGLNVLVDAQDPATSTAANFAFAKVSKPGLTTITSAAATQPPAGYRFGSPALIYDLSTTAGYSGTIGVVLQTGNIVFHHPSRVRLFHMEGGTWVDRTSATDAALGRISGVTTSLSPFAVVEPLDATPVANAGSDRVISGTNSNGAAINLTGAASTDADGDSLTYRWTGPFPEGNGTVVGLAPQVTLPMGSSKLTLTVNDGEMDSAPSTVNVTVTDFLIAAPTSQIVLKRGQSTTFNVVLSPKYGSFDDAVTISCGNLPAGVTCSTINDSATPGAQGTTATVTLTAAASAGLRVAPKPFLALCLGSVPFFGLFFIGGNRKKKWQVLVILGLALLFISSTMACGGGGGGGTSHAGNTVPTGNTSTITVTGTSGSLQHSSTVTLVLQ